MSFIKIGETIDRQLTSPGSLLGSLLLAAIVGIGGTTPVFAAPPQLPAITNPPSQEHHLGKVILVELVTPDLAATKQFYSSLFGWTFRDIAGAPTAYAEASLNGHAVAGLVHRPVRAGERRQPAWLGFFAVNDVDAAEKAALERGAQVLFKPHSFADRGREAVFADPQGATFGILASSSGDPPDFLAGPGEWIWSSLLTSEPEGAAAFYQSLFDYEVFELPPTTDSRHLLLASHDYARASVNTLVGTPSNARPYWLNYVRVEDTAAIAAKVVALGGRVLVEPRPDRHGGSIAVVADTLGAAFGLLEWPESASKEVPK